MICPYSQMRVEQVYQDVYEYDNNGAQTMHTEKLVETRAFGECKKDGCAVWHKGKCRYNGS